MFCTAVVAALLTAHVKTLPEIAGETVETKSALRPRGWGDRDPHPKTGALL